MSLTYPLILLAIGQYSEGRKQGQLPGGSTAQRHQRHEWRLYVATRTNLTRTRSARLTNTLIFYLALPEGYLCGTIFSFVGFVFLVVVGSLLKLQPMYIHNAKTPNSGANSCFEAAMLYAVALAFCYTMWRKEKLRAGELDFLTDTFTLKRDRAYYGSEDSDEELPLAKNMSPTPRMV